MSKEEFIEKIKEISTSVPNEEFFLEYNRAIYNILNENERLKEENYKLQARADKYKCRIDKAEECISNFLCTEEYINVDGKAIADNYEKILEILNGGNNE